MLNFCKYHGNYLRFKSFHYTFAPLNSIAMQVLSLELDQNQSNFFIKVRKNLASYLKNKIQHSSGFAVVANNKVENISLKFKLEVDDDSLKRKDRKGFLKGRKKSFVQFESISYQRINDNISFIKGYVTINEITKIIELEAYVRTEKPTKGKSKVVFDVLGEINKKDFNLGVDEQVTVNGIAFGRNINIEGNFEFLSN
jgi:polyisoprenoid-binding protein YceI